MPRAPAWLSPMALVEWRRVCRLLAETGLLAKLDGDMLAAYCETLATYRQSLEEIAAHGLTYQTDEGQRKRNPAVVIAAESRKDLLRMAGELGLTPIARQRLKLARPERKDELTEFLRIAQ